MRILTSAITPVLLATACAFGQASAGAETGQRAPRAALSNPSCENTAAHRDVASLVRSKDVLPFSAFMNTAKPASDCPGVCAECRADALSICGAGCVLSFACSQKDCSCSFTCKVPCTK